MAGSLQDTPAAATGGTAGTVLPEDTNQDQAVAFLLHIIKCPGAWLSQAVY
jgi:hypothetical protein